MSQRPCSGVSAAAARLSGAGFEGAGLGLSLGLAQQASIVLQTGLDVRMRWPECLLEEGQGTLIEGFGVRIPAQRLVEHRQIAQGHGHVVMRWPQEALLYGERPSVEALGLGVRPSGV